VDGRNDREIVRSLQSMGASLPREPDELAFFLNDFRYDCELADSYYNTLVAQMNAGCVIRIDAPLYCLAGSDDPLMSGYAQKFTDWACLSDRVSLIEFVGQGHYLLRDCPRDLAVSLRDIWRTRE
jgi:surfactin synthase thioesterase subunit